MNWYFLKTSQLQYFVNNLGIEQELAQKISDYIQSLGKVEKKVIMKKIRKNYKLIKQNSESLINDITQLKQLLGMENFIEKGSLNPEDSEYARNIKSDSPQFYEMMSRINYRSTEDGHSLEDYFTFYTNGTSLQKDQILKIKDQKQLYKLYQDYIRTIKSNNEVYQRGEFGDDIIEIDGETMYMKNLNTNAELVSEGQVMSHCVGTYTDQVRTGHVEIYSLRNEKNESVATIEYDPQEKDIKQIKGKGNKRPLGNYCSFIREWISKNNVSVSGDVLNLYSFKEILDKKYLEDGHDNLSEAKAIQHVAGSIGKKENGELTLYKNLSPEEREIVERILKNPEDLRYPSSYFSPYPIERLKVYSKGDRFFPDYKQIEPVLRDQYGIFNSEYNNTLTWWKRALEEYPEHKEKIKGMIHGKLTHWNEELVDKDIKDVAPIMIERDINQFDIIQSLYGDEMNFTPILKNVILKKLKGLDPFTKHDNFKSISDKVLEVFGDHDKQLNDAVWETCKKRIAYMPYEYEAEEAYKRFPEKLDEIYDWYESSLNQNVVDLVEKQNFGEYVQPHIDWKTAKSDMEHFFDDDDFYTREDGDIDLNEERDFRQMVEMTARIIFPVNTYGLTEKEIQRGINLASSVPNEAWRWGQVDLGNDLYDLALHMAWGYDSHEVNDNGITLYLRYGEDDGRMSKIGDVEMSLENLSDYEKGHFEAQTKAYQGMIDQAYKEIEEQKAFNENNPELPFFNDQEVDTTSSNWYRMRR